MSEEDVKVHFKRVEKIVFLGLFFTPIDSQRVGIYFAPQLGVAPAW